MKRSAVTDEYTFYTGKASDVVRQLSLVGFALIWLFKRDTEAGPVVPTAFLWPAFFLLLALVADFLQYAVAAPLWGWYDEELGRLKKDRDEDVKPPDRLYIPSRVCFYAKLLFLVAAFVWLLVVIGANRRVFVDVPLPTAHAPQADVRSQPQLPCTKCGEPPEKPATSNGKVALHPEGAPSR